MRRRAFLSFLAALLVPFRCALLDRAAAQEPSRPSPIDPFRSLAAERELWPTEVKRVQDVTLVEKNEAGSLYDMRLELRTPIPNDSGIIRQVAVRGRSYDFPLSMVKEAEAGVSVHHIVLSYTEAPAGKDVTDDEARSGLSKATPEDVKEAVTNQTLRIKLDHYQPLITERTSMYVPPVPAPAMGADSASPSSVGTEPQRSGGLIEPALNLSTILLTGSAVGVLAYLRRKERIGKISMTRLIGFALIVQSIIFLSTGGLSDIIRNLSLPFAAMAGYLLGKTENSERDEVQRPGDSEVQRASDSEVQCPSDSALLAAASAHQSPRDSPEPGPVETDTPQPTPGVS